MIAYNLMPAFKVFEIQEKTQKTLSTLKYKTSVIGTYFGKMGDTFKNCTYQKTKQAVCRIMELSYRLINKNL